MNKDILEKVDIHKITLLAAIGCNLKCEYCAISKSTNDVIPILFEKTVEALDNGTYVRNMLTALKRLEQSPYEIYDMDIWGQEPTIMLPYITRNWDSWYNAFPNLRKIFFSTNGIDCVDQIYDFLVMVDTVATHQMQIEIQMSYDGEYGTNNVRGGKSDIIKANCIELNKRLNHYKFSHIQVNFFYHGVISKQIIRYMDSLEKIDLYFREIDQFLSEIRQSNISRQVSWHQITLQYENGNAASTEDGLLLAEFVRKVNHIKKMNDYDHFRDGDDFTFELLGSSINIFQDQIRNSDCNSISDYVDLMIGRSNSTTNLIHSHGTYCAPGRAEMKILYDGTLVTCQNSIYDVYIEQSNLSDSIADQARLSQMKHGHRPNFVTGSDEEIEKYLSFIVFSSEGGAQYCMISNIANLIYMMAQIGEVSPSYLRDMDKIKRHAFILSNINTCYYNLVVNSGSNIMRNTNEIRFLCNGVLDIFDDALCEIDFTREKRENGGDKYRNNE